MGFAFGDLRLIPPVFVQITVQQTYQKITQLAFRSMSISCAFGE
jgi:hypothetical protein